MRKKYNTKKHDTTTTKNNPAKFHPATTQTSPIPTTNATQNSTTHHYPIQSNLKPDPIKPKTKQNKNKNESNRKQTKPILVDDVRNKTKNMIAR